MLDGIIVLAIALAMDAFGVALGIGCGRPLNVREKSLVVLSFGFFQGVLTLIGALLGNFINSYLFNISGYISGIVILALGILLFKEGLEDEEECLYYKLSFWAYIMLGISVSIDALGVGFSVLSTNNLEVLTINSVIIGLIASVFTVAAVVLANYIKDLAMVEKYADYLGGVILILFGLKILFI